MNEEKIHGCVKLEIQADYQHHSCIAQHSDQVYQEKEGEEDQPDLFRICQSHEDEVRHLCDIPSTHSVQMLQNVEKSEMIHSKNYYEFCFQKLCFQKHHDIFSLV